MVTSIYANDDDKPRLHDRHIGEYKQWRRAAVLISAPADPDSEADLELFSSRIKQCVTGVWLAHCKLEHLVAELHPKEDGMPMKAALDQVANDPNTESRIRKLARGWVDSEVRGLQDEFEKFWPLRVVLGGNGKPCRLEIVESTPTDHDTVAPSLETPGVAPVDVPTETTTQLGAGSMVAPVEEPNKEVQWWRAKYDILEMAQTIGARLQNQKKRASNTSIAKEIEKRINDIERSKGSEQRSPHWDTIRGVLTGWKLKPE